MLLLYPSTLSLTTFSTVLTLYSENESQQKRLIWWSIHVLKSYLYNFYM